MTTDTSDQEDSGQRPSKVRRALLTVLAVLSLLVAGFFGANLAIDPDGPDMEEMFFATGIGMFALAVAGLILVFRDLEVARRLDRGQVATASHQHRGRAQGPWVEPAAPPIIALEADLPDGPPPSAPGEPGTTSPRIRDTFYDVTVLEGIDVETSKDLGDHGIEDTWDLREVEPEEIAEAADVPMEVARRWRAMAELVAAEPLTPAHAALLTRCGIGSLAALARADAAALADRVNRVWADGTLRRPGQRLEADDVRPWIDAAREHRREPAPLTS